MRRIIVSMFVTLDGVMETPEKWVPPFATKEIDTFKFEETREGGALLLGKRTYQIFAGSWPSRTGELAERINGLPKYVVSTTAEQLQWNNSHHITGNVEETVVGLKQQSGQDILVAGSGVLVQTLMHQNLIDEYRLLVYPIVLGKGKRLFQEGATAKLKLSETRAFDTGVVLLRYEPSRGE
ncbi:MAG: dihydrofolate reductase [Ktedonobacteraceae bacterium]|nr:dihydrofolate reductase [Ktedonobacteraceae bacterium]